MKIQDIMTSNSIAYLNSSDPIERAAQQMKQYNVGSLPVCDQQEVIGIVTDRDIILRSVASGQNTGHKSVKDIMTPNPIVGNPNMDAHEAVRIMSENQIRRLPIVKNNKLVGMVSLGDISVEPKLQDNAEVALKNISKPTNNRFI